MSSQDPCFGVWWSSILSRPLLASLGEKAELRGKAEGAANLLDKLRALKQKLKDNGGGSRFDEVFSDDELLEVYYEKRDID